MIRNIIFDWSGTLVDDLPAVLAASNEVLRRSGLPAMSMDEFRQEFRLPFKEFYDRVVPHIPLPQLEVWFHGRFRECQELVTDLPHALEFLRFCRGKGLRTFVLSSAHADHYREQARRSGFDAFIDHSYVQVLDKRHKIEELLAKHGLRPEETLFIGDMEHDMETAHRGGLYACAVLTGYNRLEQLRNAKPHLIVEHLGELQGILERCGLELGGHLASEANGEGQESHPLRPIATVGALIFNPGGKALLVRTRKWSDRWGIPGGKIKPGEASEAALRRELQEETGLEVFDVKLVMVQDCIRSPEFYRTAHFLLLNYTCRCNGDTEVKLNEESQDYRWVTLKEARALELNRPTLNLVEAVASGAGRLPFC